MQKPNRTTLVQNRVLTSTYDKLKETIKNFTSNNPLDYIILNGDTLDFSVRSFEYSCKIARPFFQAIKNDNLAKEIIFIPGNHDKHVWDAVEWEVQVIRKLNGHKDPEKFKRTQAGVIDYTTTGKIELKGVKKAEETGHYGNLFLEGLFEKGKKLPINIVYPNLYLKTSKDTYLITHGHMLELAWVLLSELLKGDKQLVENPGIHELEEYNIPLTSMICTGVGQAGKVSKIFYKIEHEVKKDKTTRLKELIDTIIPNLDKLIELPWYAEFTDNVLLKGLRKTILSVAEDVADTRYDKEFFKKKSVRQRFFRFYNATCIQSAELGLTPPNKIIFGHTHELIPEDEPIPGGEPMEIKDISQLRDGKVCLYNSGGWLKSVGKSEEDTRAAIFFFDDNGNLSSKNIQ